jgi:hypothetical protein
VADVVKLVVVVNSVAASRAMIALVFILFGSVSITRNMPD